MKVDKNAYLIYYSYDNFYKEKETVFADSFEEALYEIKSMCKDLPDLKIESCILITKKFNNVRNTITDILNEYQYLQM